ncbi:MAG: hypothetical protein JSV19_09230 [Phycisphaerales bacterium]|nr:MAG: hypothetical protein JSV19_09230 [Phycisphaerales bacterium]
MRLLVCRIRMCLLAAALSVVPPFVDRAPGEVLQVPLATEGAGVVPAEVIVRGPWGSDAGQFGKVDEASRPGPMDFAVTGDTLYVLDPVNARVQLFDLDGNFRREVLIGTRTADFMCVDDEGNITVLDAFVGREFKTFSVSGKILAHARLPASIGLASAIFTGAGRVWIEERHNRVYEVGVARDKPGAPAKVVGTRMGRPLGRSDGAVRAEKDGTHNVVIHADAAGMAGGAVTLQFPRRVSSIVALESDDSGRVYLAASCPRASGGDQWKSDIVLVVIAPDGGIAGSLCMPDAYVTDHYRKLFVTRSGGVIQMQTTEDGLRFVRWVLEAQPDGRRS